MAYKQKGCTPITAKIQKTTKGGVTNPLLKAMGVPMKKNPSAAKQTKISNEMYNNRDMNIYGDLNKAEYDKEANRQISVRNKRFDNAKKMSKANSGGVSTFTDYTDGSTCSREDDACNAKGQSIRKRDIPYDVPKTKMRSKSQSKPVSNLKSEGVKISTPKMEGNAEIKITPKTKQTKAEKIAAKGNAKVEKIKARKVRKAERKADRVENKAARKETRANNKAARKETRANNKAARKGTRADNKAARKGTRADNKAAREEKRTKVKAARK